jgi:hypothetical protein
MTIPSRVIQALWDKANTVDGDVVQWHHLLAVLEELKVPETTALTTKPVRFSSLPVYANDAAAGSGGLTGGELYRTTTGEVRVKLPGV